MKISLQGFGENVATLEAASGVVRGSLVKITGNGKVGACGKDDIFCGVALNVREGVAAVQLGGYVQIPCETGVAVGYQSLSVSQDGKAQVAASGGRQILVADCDSANNVCGVIL